MNTPRRSTRRDFLKGRAAADRLLDLTNGPDAVEPEAQPPASRPPAFVVRETRNYLLHFSRRAMACEFEIYLDAAQYAEGAEAAVAALDRIDELEDQLSVYRDHSEISQLNQTAWREPVTVEPGLFSLLEQALEIFRATGGAYDITSGPLSKVWGFFRRAGRMPHEEEIAQALSHIGSQYVELDRAERTVRFLREGLEVNVNSIGKGYALDRAAEVLEDAGVGDFLFHGGQSSVLARGTHRDMPEQGWSVGLRHPLRPDRRIAQFFLRDQALGTSGSGTQFFQHQGKRYGHLLDPRSGKPAEGVYSATVIASTAAQADALATAFYVLGPEAALQFCQARPDLALLMVCPGERSGTIALHQHGLSEANFELLEKV